MEPETLSICVSEEVLVFEGEMPRPRRQKAASPYFQPEFKFSMDKQKDWAPAQSRAPSVTIEFGLEEAWAF